jgi:hypothetical protein
VIHQSHVYSKPHLFFPLTVPTFDGRDSFKLSAFQSLPTIEEELETNSAVMVIFTLSSCTNSILMHHQDCDNLNLNLSLNIQSVVLLANADHTTDDLVAEEVEPLGLEVQPGSGNTSSVTASEEEDTV